MVEPPVLGFNDLLEAKRMKADMIFSKAMVTSMDIGTTRLQEICGGPVL